MLLGGCTPSGEGMSAADPRNPVSAELAPCRLKGIEIELRCGNLQVPEQRSPGPGTAASGRQISIHYAIIPAVARGRTADPVFVFAGGPGQSATGIAALVLPLFDKLNKNRDIVFVDQRGTGQSNPLACDLPRSGSLAEALAPGAQEGLITQCAQKLQSKGNDLTQYITSIAVRDIDAVRERLGYGKINIWGGSYGTRAALEYLHQFPQQVRSVVLDGVAPMDMKLPLTFAVDADAAVRRLTLDCAADAACSKAYPTLDADVDRLFQRLANGALDVRLTNPVSGRVETVKMARDTFVSWLRTPLYSSTTASLVPSAVAHASQGNFDTLAALNASAGASDAISIGMHLSVICAEDMSNIGPDDLAAVQNTRFGTAFYDQYRRMCAHWPSGRAPRADFAPVQSDVPVLMLSGKLDPATPPRHAEFAARTLANATLWVAPNVGHGVSMQGCAAGLVDKFIRQGNARDLDAACLASIPRPPFFEAIADSPGSAP